MSEIKVLIADDQALMRDGLRTILELDDGIQVVGTAKDGLEAYELTGELRPDIVLMDIRMPKLNGVESTKKIKNEFAGIVVLALTTFDDQEYIVEILKNGAEGYLLKDIDSQRLITAIKDAITGNLIMPAQIAIKLVESLSDDRSEDLSAEINDQNPPENQEISSLSEEYNLSSREEEVAIMLAQGFTNKQIASALYISHGTVKNYVSNIYSKLGISDRTKAAIHLNKLFGPKDNIT